MTTTILPSARSRNAQQLARFALTLTLCFALPAFAQSGDAYFGQGIIEWVVDNVIFTIALVALIVAVAASWFGMGGAGNKAAGIALGAAAIFFLVGVAVEIKGRMGR